VAYSVDQTFRRALASLQAGKLDDAERSFKKLLREDPKHVAGLNLLSILLTQLGRFEEAEHNVRLALKQNGTSDATLYNYGIILKGLKRPAEALERFSQALAINAKVAETWNNRGTVFSDLGRHNEAIADFDKAISLNSNYAEAFNNKGKSLGELKLYDQSLAAYDRALTLKRDLAQAWVGRGGVLTALKQYNGALAAYDRALKLKPDLAEAWLGHGNALIALKRFNDASAAYGRALKLRPDLPEAWLGHGNALIALDRYDDASAAYKRALTLKPDLAGAWLALGHVFIALRQHNDALAAYGRALTLKPELSEAWLGRGIILTEFMQYEDALGAFDRALTLNPDLAEAWAGRGGISFASRHYDNALADFDRAFKIKPDLKCVEAARLHAKAMICDWTDWGDQVTRLLSAIRNGALARPFHILSIASSAADQLANAKRFVADQFPPASPALWNGEIYRHDRIRVGYFSSDLRDHPVARLMADVFEQHDRSRFELTAISLGAERDSDIHRELKNSFEHFVYAGQRGDQEIAELVRQREIEIAVNLNGFTQSSRTGVFARRPAPIQINYLGYPGTMGADYIDYIISDRFAIPEDHCRHYRERVVYLPDCFQANSSTRSFPQRIPTRVEAGLPETGFVFCSFCNTYKIIPEMFDVWMRLLRQVEGSVLWLLKSDAAVEGNLRREARSRGIEPDRLIFAPSVEFSAYLARYRLADLFLDTFPFNGGTTASDALWAGLPLVTYAGEALAARMAGSLLHAVGLEELVTYAPEDYESLALKLARDCDLLSSLKARLARNRDTCPLFDTRRFTRHLEAAYVTMWERYRSAEPPMHFAVS
jgi:protein O-GlcNAc transferase